LRAGPGEGGAMTPSIPGLVLAEFGPATWTSEQWLGLALAGGVFLVAVWLIYRISRPDADVDEGGPPGS